MSVHTQKRYDNAYDIDSARDILDQCYELPVFQRFSS